MFAIALLLILALAMVVAGALRIAGVLDQMNDQADTSEIRAHAFAAAACAEQGLVYRLEH